MRNRVGIQHRRIFKLNLVVIVLICLRVSLRLLVKVLALDIKTNCLIKRWLLRWKRNVLFSLLLAPELLLYLCLREFNCVLIALI